MSEDQNQEAQETEADIVEEAPADAEAPEAADSSGESTAADEIAALQEEIAALRDQVLRERAEAENTRRRAEKDKADAKAYAVTNFARDILSVSDNIRRAMDSKPADIPADLTAFIEGMELTERELLATLTRHGISEITPAAGDKFDPKSHQAMFEVPTDEHPSGAVVQVITSGYQIKDRLLRPAMVGVAKAAAKPAGVDTEA